MNESNVRSRRAVSLVVLSMLVPGSAQRVAGNQMVGRAALRVAAGVLVALVLLTFIALIDRGRVVGLLLHPVATIGAKVLLWGLFLGWALLLLDSWRLARPPRLVRRARLVLTLLVVTGLVVAASATAFLSRGLTAAEQVSAVFAGGGRTDATAGRYNILLLGADAAEGRVGIRPDSINVASVDAATGRTVIFGLPRNLAKVPFPASSPLVDLHPEGYDCDGCYLNAIHTLGEDNAELYPGQDAGLTAMREAVGHVLGLDINYYAMVDMAGFSRLVDALGGVTLDSNVRVPIGGVSNPVVDWIEPGDDVHLDGHQALWYARSRHGSSDYERMVRQKCVMKAMAKQLDPATVATRFVALSKAGRDLVSTDVPAQEVVELTELALKAKDLPFEIINFSPPLITPADPDFDLIRAQVAEALEPPKAAEPSPSPTDKAPSEKPRPEEPSPSPKPDAVSPPATTKVSPAPVPTTKAAQTAAPAPKTSEAPEAPAEEDVEWLCRVG